MVHNRALMQRNTDNNLINIVKNIYGIFFSTGMLWCSVLIVLAPSAVAGYFYNCWILSYVCASIVLITLSLYVKQLYVTDWYEHQDKGILGLIGLVVKSGHHVSGSHVVITGGSKGIGLSLALECVKRGASCVTIIARQKTDLLLAQERCLQVAKGNGVGVIIQILSADLLDINDSTNVMNKVTLLQGELRSNLDECKYNEKITLSSNMPIDFLFCNAGKVVPIPFVEMDDKDITDTFTANVISPFVSVKCVLNKMIQRRNGVICFTNSLAAMAPIYGYSAYASSKASLKTFAECLEQELVGTGVNICNAYLPSVDTPGYKDEVKCRSKLTALMEGTVYVHSSDAVARRMLDGIEAGHRTITIDLVGWALARCCSGFSRAESAANFMFEVFFGWFLRLMATALFLKFLHLIRREQITSGREKGK